MSSIMATRGFKDSLRPRAEQLLRDIGEIVGYSARTQFLSMIDAFSGRRYRLSNAFIGYCDPS
jgi:hypothetical protein